MNVSQPSPSGDPQDGTVHTGKADRANCLHSWWGQLLTDRRDQRLWLVLPAAAPHLLCDMFSCIEQAGVWPPSCLHWRTVCIFEGSANGEDSRANLLYRVSVGFARPILVESLCRSFVRPRSGRWFCGS